jgi:hypothetical protein
MVLPSTSLGGSTISGTVTARNDYFDQGPHRTGGAKCSFYPPEDATKAQLLEAQANITKILSGQCGSADPQFLLLQFRRQRLPHIRPNSLYNRDARRFPFVLPHNIAVSP